MSYFRVMLHGGEILVWPGGSIGDALTDGLPNEPVVGFYTTRIIRAVDRDAAIAAAIRSAEKELRSQGFEKLNKGKAPVFEVEEISELNFWGYLIAKPRRGFTWYLGDHPQHESVM